MSVFRRIRWRRLFKRLGIGLSVILLTLTVLSGWFEIQVNAKLGSRRFAMCTLPNRLGILALDPSVHWTQPFEITLWPEPHVPHFGFRDIFRFDWVSVPSRYEGIDAPLETLLLAVIFPTALLCYLDRRRIPPGHCRNCGYNLTGNVSGLCPECGHSFRRETQVS